MRLYKYYVFTDGPTIYLAIARRSLYS